METHRSERPRDQGERVRLEAEELGLETQQCGWRRQRPKECPAEGHSGTLAPCCVQGCQRPRSEPSHGTLSESRPGPAPAGMLLGWTPCWGLSELREKGAHGGPWGRTASSPLIRGGDLGGAEIYLAHPFKARNPQCVLPRTGRVSRSCCFQVHTAKYLAESPQDPSDI